VATTGCSDLSSKPTIRDYQVTFLPIQDLRDTPLGGWQIERIYYREIITRKLVTEG
jgi:hypothetical protein